MANSYSFRTALNGFNREDVVHYLEYINTKNANQIAQLERELQRLQSVESWKNQVAALEQENAALRQELEALKAQKAEPLPCNDEEQEAHRRAECIERRAQQRAEQICMRAMGVVADAGIKMDDTMAQVGTLADQTMQQLQDLQQAVLDSKTVLQQASTALGSIRPE